MAEGLYISEKVADGVCIVELSGEIDIYTSRSLKDKLYNLADTYKGDLKIDCRALNYIDSTGLGILVGTLKKTNQYGKNVYILNLKDSIKKLFVITGLDKVFIIEE